MSSIHIQEPSFEEVICDSCVNPVPLALAYHVTDAQYEDRNLIACSRRCAHDIAGKLRVIDDERPRQPIAPIEVEAIAKPMRHDTPRLRMNMMSYSPLALAHELAVRQNELYEAMQIVERCGASAELTDAITRLGERLRSIQDSMVDACKEAIGDEREGRELEC